MAAPDPVTIGFNIESPITYGMRVEGEFRVSAERVDVTIPIGMLGWMTRAQARNEVDPIYWTA